MIAEISFAHYDKRCGLLSVKVKLRNPSDVSLYVATGDFAFLGIPGQGQYPLRFDETPDRLILDLSHTLPTADGFDYYRGEDGSYGRVPCTWELKPRDFRYTTYVFKFPLPLDFRVSDVRWLRRPSGSRQVSLRFGYGLEPYEVWHKREFRETLTIEEYQKRVVEDWQRCVETDSVTIDFSTDGGDNVSRGSRGELEQ